MPISDSNFTMPAPLPPDVFELRDEPFFSAVKEQCGMTMVEILRYLEVNSADSLPDNDDIFSFFRHDSLDLLPIKGRVGITLSSGDFVVKEGLSLQAGILVNALKAFRQRRTLSNDGDVTISASLLNRYPVIRHILCFFEKSARQVDQSLAAFDHTVFETIMFNHGGAKSCFSHNESVGELATCLFILAGRNAYEFARLNIRGLLPSLTSIQASLDSTVNRVEEGEFRYDLMSEYLSSEKTKFIFAAEDCTAVVCRIVYDVHSNTFVGFASALRNGLPTINAFSTESFTELENWFQAATQSHLLNLHMIQPIGHGPVPCSSFLLSAYGTDNCFSGQYIIMRWISIVNHCENKGVKMIGFASDCDPRYFRSMRVLMGFFVDAPNHQFHMNSNAFSVIVPEVSLVRWMSMHFILTYSSCYSLGRGSS